MMNRSDLLILLAERILALDLPHPTRVGIDGVDAAGKTTLADELAQTLAARTHRQIIRASIDRFHNPHAVRARQGSDSPEGYFADSFNLPALKQLLLDPLGPGSEDRSVQTAIFDVLADQPVSAETTNAAPDALLIFDGIFLHRPELAEVWDISVFLQVDFDTVLERAARRDHERASIGSEQAILERYYKRYLPAQRRYLQDCQPAERATILIDNNKPSAPIILRENAAKRSLPG